jgi:hypothetical protein
MPRGMVGLLAAVAAATAVLASLAPAYLIWAIAAVVAVAAGLVGYVTAPGDRSSLSLPPPYIKKIVWLRDIGQLTDKQCGGIAARVTDRAFGLALAVRPAGLVEAPSPEDAAQSAHCCPISGISGSISQREDSVRSPAGYRRARTASSGCPQPTRQSLSAAYRTADTVRRSRPTAVTIRIRSCESDAPCRIFAL